MSFEEYNENNLEDTTSFRIEEPDDLVYEEFEYDKKTHKESPQRKWNLHLIFICVALCIFLFSMVRLFMWNKGKDSDYDPTEDTSQFDTERQDYIQPMSASRLEGFVADDVTTILCLGNAPFADNKGHGLDQALANTVNGKSINGSFGISYQAMEAYPEQDDSPIDAFSLYGIVKALCTNDFSFQDKASTQVPFNDSDRSALEDLKQVDMNTIDMLVIMYDCEDYFAKHPVYDPGYEDNPITFAGALKASLKLLEEKYPHIRTVVLSTPACGKTIDDYYVDGDVIDFGNGTLVDYLLYDVQTVMSEGMSFIDNYYGTITVDNRDKYLYDDYHLNEAGIQAIAERFAEYFGD